MFHQLGAIVPGMSALLTVAKWVAAKAGKAAAADSMVSYTSVARVEPFVLVDQTLEQSDMLPQTMQSTLAIFTGYYLQAYTLSTLSVGKINLVKHLDQLNTTRDVGGAVLSRLGMESINDFEHRLPVPYDSREYSVALENYNMFANAEVKFKGLTYAQETMYNGAGAFDSMASTVKGYKTTKTDAKKDPKSSASLARDASDLTESVDLSVGRLVNVELVDGDNKTIVPISIRLRTAVIKQDPLLHILSFDKKDNSMKERWHMFKAGQITFIKDLIFCQDMIDEYQKNLLADKTGLYESMMLRRRNNTLVGAIAGSEGYSVNNASNIMIISSDTAAQLALKINGPLSNFKVRQKIFERSYLMLLIVVDADHNRVTFYHRGISDSTTVSHRDMVASNKGTGPSVSDILQAYRAGNSPTM